MDAQALMNLIRANEEAPGFDLGSWFTDCGTHGCLVGNFCVANRQDRLRWTGRFELDGVMVGLGEQYSMISKRFGITSRECFWLFGTHGFTEPGCGIAVKQSEDGDWLFFGPTRNYKDRTAAINRVRKFLYYKLHKRELLYDEKGCVRESARKAEGDHHVVRKALAFGMGHHGGAYCSDATPAELAAAVREQTVGGGA